MPQLVVTANKVTLVGEANPYGGDPYYALYPHPEGCSGWRLCCLVLGMRRVDYLAAFDRVNLCPRDWDGRQARSAADALTLEGKRLVLCGAKVCRAFSVPYVPFCAARGFPTQSGALVLPHPSGLCRKWNEAGSYQRAREAVEAFAPELAHLLGRRDRGHPDPEVEPTLSELCAGEEEWR
jgi:hypothetical protein